MFVELSDYISLTDWAEDAYVALTDVSAGSSYLMEPWEFKRAGDALIADAVEEYTNIKASQSPLIFQGGNCLIGTDFWLLGKDYFADTVELLEQQRPPVAVPDDQNIDEFTRKLFSKYVDKRRKLHLIGTRKPIPIREYIGIPRIKMEILENHYAPELMNRFFDTITIQKGVAKLLMDFTAAALSIIFGLILLSFYHPFFIISSILVFLIVFILGNYVFQRGLKSSITESKYKYKVAFWLEEVARTNTTFRLSCDASLPINKTDYLVSSYLDAREKHFKVLLRQYYIFLVFKVMIAAGFLVLGGILVFNQQMNIGQCVAAEIIVLLLISSVEKLLLYMETIYDLLTSIEKIGEVTDMDLENATPNAYLSVKKNEGLSVNIKQSGNDANPRWPLCDRGAAITDPLTDGDFLHCQNAAAQGHHRLEVKARGILGGPNGLPP